MKKIVFALSSLSFLMFANNAFAVDTTELLDKGVVEVAPTTGLANIHDGKPGWMSDIALAYGVADFMTISTTFAMGTNVALYNLGEVNADGDIEGADLGFGFDFDVLFTPVDTDHFDIDFHVDFGWDGGYAIAPGLEFNFDSDNEMSGFGAFVTLDLPIHSGVNPKAGDKDIEDTVRTDLDIEWSLGLYYNIMEGHQLLVAGGMAIENVAKKLADEATYVGNVALGYNVELFENFELVNEVAIEIPKGGDDVSASITVGAIIDLPMM